MSNPGLYIHVPFCRTKCAYCGFASGTDLSLIPHWLEAFKKEVGFYKGIFDSFDSVFLGGGTPTVLSHSELYSLVNSLSSDFSFRDPIEFTVEANPDDLTADLLAPLKDLGVNRMSIGIQSLEDSELAFLGRRHSAFQAESALDLVKRAGFKSLSADLMYGLPGQTLSGWLKTLRRVLSFEPDHLSCYQLTLEKHTPLYRMMAQGKIRKAGVKFERELFLATSQFLEQEGYLHYEVSNFAKPGHLCRHNLKYWNSSPYLGLGPSAHSFDGIGRWWNTRSIQAYFRHVSRGRPPIAGKEILSEEKKFVESLLLGFRTSQGIEIETVSGVPGLDSKLRHLQQSGLILVQEGKIIPTREGLLYADGLPLLLMD